MQHSPAQQDAPTVVGVIDPDPVARNGLRTLLHGLGIDVSTYDSAESYLLAANGRHASCLIVELLLPGMGGVARVIVDRRTLASYIFFPLKNLY